MKLIATDLDGTLLNSRHEVSNENVSALKLAREKGDEVVIATGRTYADANAICKKIGVDAHIISNNGSFVYSKHGEKLKAITLEKEKIKDILKWLSDNEYYYDIATDKTTFVPFNMKNILRNDFNKTKMNNDSLSEELLHYTIDLILSQKGIELIKDIDDIMHRDEEYCKITINSFDKNKRVKGTEFFSKDESLSVVSSARFNFEIMNVSASKGNSLEYLAKYLNISLSDTAAIGDNYNDISMFNKAAVSVAMGNANEDIKKVCKYISKSNDLHGVAYALHEFVYKSKLKSSLA
ncbi:Cof-type HAD-IIB family hydrolase [Clostridium sp. DJ247]|uniref:Cof-type HAD-IIB family hydrolase n=1 Tax=Clostridium sp. DJ247 TaxID=2726188 RepID=UPI00162952DB|nr:Cof-type HAD-IIB family hydrolase [Clostridium sp. DJ247]MBC2581290.1 HAD family phosphatase [Clostridium sp. DJ247]